MFPRRFGSMMENYLLFGTLQIISWQSIHQSLDDKTELTGSPSGLQADILRPACITRSSRGTVCHILNIFPTNRKYVQRCQNIVCHSGRVLLYWSCDDGTSCSSATERPRTSVFNGTDCWEWRSWLGWRFAEETASWGTSWDKAVPVVGDVGENTPCECRLLCRHLFQPYCSKWTHIQMVTKTEGHLSALEMEATSLKVLISLFGKWCTVNGGHIMALYCVSIHFTVLWYITGF